MIKAKDLKKAFVKITEKKKKELFYADNGISFEAHDGEIIGILGPNGAGKTTLLRMIAGILEPTEGTIEFDNLNYKNNEIEIKLDSRQDIDNIVKFRLHRYNIKHCEYMEEHSSYTHNDKITADFGVFKDDECLGGCWIYLVWMVYAY